MWRLLFAFFAVLTSGCLFDIRGLAPHDAGSSDSTVDDGSGHDVTVSTDSDIVDSGHHDGDVSMTDGDGDTEGDDGDIQSDVDVSPDADNPVDADVEETTDADEEEEPPECLSEEITCDGDTLLRCEAERWVTGEVCPLGCSVVHGRCYGVDSSNVTHGFFASASGDVTISSSISVNTDDCAAVGGVLSPEPVFSEAVVLDGMELCVIVVERFTIDEEADLRFVGGLIPVIMATDEVMIDGTLDMSAIQGQPGPGGGEGGEANNDAPGGICGGGRGEHSGEFQDSGGGGGGHGASGGSGAGTDSSEAGRAGQIFGSDSLSPITTGCGGGGGSDSGRGGAGGGALQVTSSVGIHVGTTGIIRAHGGGGGGGSEGAGGGGSGGGILLEAPEIEILGFVVANGGGGGSGDGNENGSDGLDGDTRASGGRDTGSWGGEGGDGGAGASNANGESAPNVDYDGGGGGGGVGRIRFNSRYSAADIGPDALLSPSELGFSEGAIATW